MTNRSPHVSHATVEDRKALLNALKVPAGQATVERRVLDGGEQLVVRLSPGVHPATRPETFRGHQVRYENLMPALAW